MQKNTKNNHLKYSNILELRKAYAEGENITELLKNKANITENTPEIIESAYDLQAGSYIQYTQENQERADLYAAELASIINDHINAGDSLVDIGTGELTTLSLIENRLTAQLENILAFDISWSRIYKGVTYAKEHMRNYNLLTPFVANMGDILLLNGSVDVTISSHALEPNGGKELELISELFPITRKKIILFEPCYEINSDEGKERMNKLGYIKNIDGTVEALGGKVLDKIKIKNVSNPLNPTVCYVIVPPAKKVHESHGNKTVFSVPGTNYPLERVDSFYFSNEIGLFFPVIKSIPVLKENVAVLASAFSQ